MYEFLRGSVISARGTQVVLEVAGVGWLLNTSLGTSRRLVAGAQARLFVHLVVREDVLALYGFHETLERQLFRELIGISLGKTPPDRPRARAATASDSGRGGRRRLRTASDAMW